MDQSLALIAAERALIFNNRNCYNKRMWKKIIIGVVVVIIIGGVAFYYINRTPSVTEACATPDGDVTIVYGSDSTFAPNCVIVSAGTKITWNNQSSNDIDVSADPHPTHTGNREVSNGAFDLRIKPGEQATVTMTTPGDHGFHDHYRFTAKGVIRVQ